MVGLPDDEKTFEDICNRLDRIPACDGRTDRRTSCHGIVRATHTRRAVKDKLLNSIKNTLNTHYVQSKALQYSQNVLTELSYLLINFGDLSLTVKLGST